MSEQDPIPVASLNANPDMEMIQRLQFQRQTPTKMRRLLLRDRAIMEQNYKDRAAIIDIELAKLDEIEKNG